LVETGLNLKIGGEMSDKKVTVVLAQFRGGTADIYVQKQIDKINKESSSQDGNVFAEEIKLLFSNKVDSTEWQIRTFRQGEKDIADYLFQFKVLAIKAGVNDAHAIFLLEVSCERTSLCKKRQIPKWPRESRSNIRDFPEGFFLFSHLAFTGYLITHS